MKRFYTFFVILIAFSCWINIANGQVVNIPDANLAAVVRNELGLAPNAPITKQALQALDSLAAPYFLIRDITGDGGEITNLTGLEHATQLTFLWLDYNLIQDIQPLTRLTQLQGLLIRGNPIDDLSPLTQLTQLRELGIDVKRISDLHRHVDLTQLVTLHLNGSGSQIIDLHLLAELTQLRALDLSDISISDLGFLRELKQLDGLYIWRTGISDLESFVDLEPLAGLTGLRRLEINNYQIRDVSPLAGLKNLESLHLDKGNQIRDVSPLAGLKNLKFLGLAGNQIRDVSPLAGLKNLEFLYLAGNQIRDVSPLAGLTRIKRLTLTVNQIRDVSPLAGLKNLESLRLEENQIQDTSPLRTLLAQNPNLELDIDVSEPPPTNVPGANTVRMPDANLAAVVRKALGLRANAPITKQAIQKLTILEARESQIKSLTGLEHATQLVHLLLYRNQIRDIKPLSGLTRLKGLDLGENQIRNFQPIVALTQLEVLNLGGNQNNQSVPLLTNLTQLTWLFLYGNQISDIKSLANLTKLKGLSLDHNKIRDVSPLAGLVNLETLELRDNAIRDIRPLANLTKLTDLKLKGNPVQDTSPLANLTKLKDVDINIAANPKIEGPWLWMIVPTGHTSGADAVHAGTDWLAKVSGGAVTERQIATRGATPGTPIGNKVWTPGRITPTGGDNINDLVNTIGLGNGGNIDRHVAYGSIILDSPREQNTKMYVGSDDAVQVWLNGTLVHTNLVNRAAADYQEDFPVTLKSGRNILLVAVYELGGTWSGFFGFENRAVYTLYLPPVVHVSATERPPMYWIDTNSGTLHRLIGDDVENLLPNVRNATHLALDVENEKLYWTEQTSDKTGRIRRASLDGTNVQLVKNLTSVPLAVALDTSGGKIYLTNGWGKVQRMNVDGTNFQPNLITGLTEPHHLAVEGTGGKVYWTEKTGNRSGKLRSANLDGTNVQLVKALTSVPMGLAVDAAASKLYLTNGWGKVQRLNVNGRNFQPNLITGLNSPRGVAVDVGAGKVYWTESDKIRRANLDSTNIQDVVTGLGAAASITLAPVSVPAVVPAAPMQVAAVSDKTALLANYPNPFNPETWIPYQLSKSAEVRVSIYSVEGRLIRSLALSHQNAGRYQSRSRAAYWDGRNAFGEPVASGVYFYTLTAGDFFATRRMLILK